MNIFKFLMICLMITTASIGYGQESITIDHIRLIDEKIIDFRLEFEGTIVGGLSGIDFNGQETWFLLSDDSSVHGDSRFYTARLDYTLQGFTEVELIDVVLLQGPNTETFPPYYADPEAIRFHPINKTLLWVSEGNQQTLDHVIQPFIQEMSMMGVYQREIPLPSIFQIYQIEEKKGPYHNQVFESLALSLDGQDIWVATENALFEDGLAPDLEKPPIRLTQIDYETGKLKGQYVYHLTDGGLVDLLAIDDHRFLGLERFYSSETGNVITLFEVDIAEATDVSKLSSLIDADYVPVQKRLILNFAEAGVSRVDNLEGLAWGHILENGHRSLVMVSDDNFNEHQINQILVFEVVP